MSGAERLLVALLALALFLPGIAAHDLWNPDEPRYAEVALEMRDSGSWFVPQLNGRTYSEKPPLHFWSIAAFSAIPGMPIEAAARLPSVVAALVTLLVAGELALLLVGRAAVWPTILILASSSKFLWQGRVGQIDMTLLALVSLAVLFFVRGMIEERPALYRGFFLFAGLATLAKGPVGLLPPLLGIVLFALATGRRRLLAEMRIPTGLALWALVVLCWLVPAGLLGGADYLRTIVFKQNLTRFADPWHHFKPWYYYLTVVPIDFFPWSLFLPGAVWVGWRRLTGEARRGFLFALSWATATLVFFSLSPAKRTVYILPVYPACALLVAAALVEIEDGRERLRRYLTVPAGLLAALLAALPVAGWVAVAHPPARWAATMERVLAEARPLGPGALGWLAALGVLVALGAVAAWLAARAGRPRTAIRLLAAAFGSLAVAAALVVLPRFDAVKSARPLSTVLRENAAPGEPYAIWPRLDAPFLVYTGRHAVELADEGALRAFAARPGRVWVLIEKEALERLDPALPLVEVARDGERVGGYVLLASPG